jgi:hypothetical protein
MNRRDFLNTVPIAAVTPMFIGEQKQQKKDSLLEHFEKEAKRIKAEIESGERGPKQAQALESLLRVQAVHFEAQGYNDLIKNAIASKIKEVGSREALINELLTAGAAVGLAPVQFDVMLKVLTDIELNGLSGRFIKHADFLRDNSHKLNGKLIKAGQGWYDWACGWAGSIIEADTQMMQMWCSVSYFLGWYAGAFCAMWAFELGAEALLFMAIC